MQEIKIRNWEMISKMCLGKVDYGLPKSIFFHLILTQGINRRKSKSSHLLKMTDKIGRLIGVEGVQS